MFSKNQIKLIKSLSQKKYRQKYGMFVVEGRKSIAEFLEAGYTLKNLYSTKENWRDVESEIISESDLKKISFLVTPNEDLAVFQIPRIPEIEESNNLILVLDGLQDPGNLGTIIRLCDWFGIEELVCSKETVDCYNPKVVQASMGSLSRIKIHYIALKPFLKQFSNVKYGAFMDGENVYKKKLKNNSILVLGNEGKGISDEINNLIDEKISIPQFGKIQETESLNVASAASVLLSEFRRRTTGK